MHHHIFDIRLVDRALGGAAPGFLGGGVIVVQTDHVDIVEVGEFEAARVLDPAAEDEVQLAHGRPASSKLPPCEAAT